MTNKELVKHFKGNLIPYYKKILKDMPRGYIKVRKHIMKRYAPLGICYCSKVIFYKNIFKHPVIIHIARELGYGGYWAKCPYECGNIKDIKKVLKERIEIMEDVVNIITRIKKP